MRRKPGASHQPRSITSSPSSRKRRISPVGSSIGSVPRQVTSSRQPRFSFSGPGHRAAADQVAGAQGAAVRSVMRHHLRQRPVHGGEIAAAHAHRLRHLRGAQPDFERDPVRVVGGAWQIRQRWRVARRARLRRRRNGSSASHGDDPRRNGCGEILRRETDRAADIPSVWISRADQSLSRQTPKR